MAGRFPPPPTYAAIELDAEGSFYFSPIWLQWFNALSAPLNASGITAPEFSDSEFRVFDNGDSSKEIAL